MASEYQLEGKIKLISDVQTFKSGFTKREFVVVEEEGKFPQEIKFECVKEKCGLLDGFSEGDGVNVSFNIRGNEYNGRYYVNLQAWRIDRVGGAGASGGGSAEGDEPGPGEPPPGYGEESDDGIPF